LDHIARSIAWYDRPSAASGQVMGTRQLPQEGHMAARTRLEQVRMVILQRRVRATQFRSEPAGAFQSHIAHIMKRDTSWTDGCGAVSRYERAGKEVLYITIVLRNPAIRGTQISHLSTATIRFWGCFWSVARDWQALGFRKLAAARPFAHQRRAAALVACHNRRGVTAHPI